MDDQKKKKDFLERLRSTFKEEADEHVKTIISGLIQLEKSSAISQQEPIIETIYSHTHSLKGAAQSVDFTAIESICQAFESVIRKFKHIGFIPSPGIFDVLHRAMDTINKLNFMGTQSPPENVEISGIIRQLDELEGPPSFIHSVEESRGEIPGAGRTDTEEKYKSKERRKQILEDVEARRLQKRQDRPTSLTGSTVDTVRVSAAKLDRALLQAEELIYVKLSFNRLAGELGYIREELNNWRTKTSQISPLSIQYLHKKLLAISRYLENDRLSVGSLIDSHLEDTKELLMLPLSILTEGFPKIVRDLARANEKKVDIIIEGAEIEIDKRVFEWLKDPLLHLLRNAVDHGIETPQVRTQKNKPDVGTIRMTISRLESGKIKICFSDDGAGINIEKVKEKSIASGLITIEKLQKMADQEIMDMVFRPELSTAPLGSDISGRGLGLYIARENIEKLGGSISVATETDKGTTFNIVLPLARGAFRGVLVKVGTAKFIIPLLDVEHTLQMRAEDIKTIENREVILIDGRAVSHVPLATVLNLSREAPREAPGNKVPEFLQIVLLKADGIQMAFSVDEILDKEEVLVKSMGPQLRRVINISGAVILGSTEIVPILNVSDLIKSAIKMSGKPLTPSTSNEEAITANPLSVLLVEDSITARMLLKNIMESAGYKVTTAVDGMDGWISLQQGHFDIVVLDVDMPRMNGFELTAKIRADKKLAAIPIVLVTSLESEADREKGIEVGANAYIVKSSFDQSHLLAVMKKML